MLQGLYVPLHIFTNSFQVRCEGCMWLSDDTRRSAGTINCCNCQQPTLGARCSSASLVHRAQVHWADIISHRLH